jgi:hypothetical protein
MALLTLSVSCHFMIRHLGAQRVMLCNTSHWFTGEAGINQGQLHPAHPYLRIYIVLHGSFLWTSGLAKACSSPSDFRSTRGNSQSCWHLFWGRVTLCSPCRPQTHNPPASCLLLLPPKCCEETFKVLAWSHPLVYQWPKQVWTVPQGTKKYNPWVMGKTSVTSKGCAYMQHNELEPIRAMQISTALRFHLQSQ